MSWSRNSLSLIGAGLIAFCGVASAQAQGRTHWISGSSFSDSTIAGPTSVRIGDVDSWTATARWTFTYDLLPGERIDLSAVALTFPEFTPPDDYYPADVTPFRSIICEPDCMGDASFFVTFTATGAFEPPTGTTTQPIYLIPIAKLTSTRDSGISYYDFPIAVPFKTIEVAIPEPSLWSLMIGGFGLAGRSLRRRRAAVR